MSATPPGESERVSTNERLLQHIYDCYRDVFVGWKYSAARLTRIQRQSRWIEIFLALAAPGAVGGWTIWHTATGATVWALFAGTVLVLTVAKPFMNWQSEVERRTAIYVDFNALYFELKNLVIQISTDGGVSSETQKKFFEAWLRYTKIAGDEDPVRAKRLLRRCQEDLDREIPPEKLWMPSQGVTNPGQPSLRN